MTVEFKPVRLAIDDEARRVERDGRLLGIVTLHDADEIGALHTENKCLDAAPAAVPRKHGSGRSPVTDRGYYEPRPQRLVGLPVKAGESPPEVMPPHKGA